MSRTPTLRRRGAYALLALAVSVTTVQCATNPATGEKQIAMISEEREIAMGKEADGQISASMGLYDDPELTAYVDAIGQRLAASSERPHLDWTFRVIDDSAVNAFALPGGFVYVTRGILAHMNSEAELAGVLGHEIGHVTGRHSVNRLSKQQLGSVGLAAVSVAARASGASWAGLAEAGAQLGTTMLLMKFSRAHESQADDLGLRYMRRGDYDPRQMPGVFAMLEAVSQEGQGGRAPGWLSTHPNPDARGERSVAKIERLDEAALTGRIGREDFLGYLEGVPFGPDPRQGYFRDSLFLHPDMRFQIDFPDEWMTQNQRTQVVAINPEKDVLIQLTLVDADSASEAARDFLDQDGIDAERPWNRELNGLQASGAGWEASGEDRTYAGQVAFIEWNDSIFRLNSMGLEDDFRRDRAEVRESLRSFRPLTDRDVLAVKPFELDVVTVRQPMSLRALADEMRSPVPIEKLAVMNRRSADEPIPAGTMVKIVVGDPLP